MNQDRWVKTFIQPDSQVNLTIVPKGKMFVVTASVMLGGKMFVNTVYNGDNEDRAINAFDNFNRHEAVLIVNYYLDDPTDSGDALIKKGKVAKKEVIVEDSKNDAINDRI